MIFHVNSFASQYATQWNETCQNNPEKEYFICSQNEEATAILSNATLELECRITLEVYSRDKENSENDRDQLVIRIPMMDDFGVGFSPVLSFYIKRGNIYEQSYLGFNYEEQHELNGEIFQDVFYSFTPNYAEKLTEIYYTAKLGIIGFRDKNGILWTFNKFN